MNGELIDLQEGLTETNGSAKPKQSCDDLAYFGGEPAFSGKLHVGRPNIGDRRRLTERIDAILDSRWLSNGGPYVREFEQRVAEIAGVKHCVAMCNGTVALEIAIRAAGLSGEVIVPSLTFIATAHALQWQEITPVFCDIDPVTKTLDPGRVERLVTPRTTGIIGVHLWGRPCDVEGLTRVAERHNLNLLFDAAHAFGCTYKRRNVGGFGLAEVFSFHPTKFLNALEGGAVVTDDDELARRMRLMKNFGFETMDSVIYIGTNGKMNEVSAAMGLTSLESMEDFIAWNRNNYKLYQRELQGIPGVKLLPYDETERSNYQYIVIELHEEVAGLSRDRLVTLLTAENVIARRYFYPGCHRMEPYRSYFPNAGLLLPETERTVARVISLPTGTAVGEREVRGVCDIIRFAVTHGYEISEKMSPLPVQAEVFVG